MSSALRRRLAALQNLTEQRGATPGEAAAARLAEARILRRLGDDAERLVERGPEYYSPAEKAARKRARRRAARQERLHVGDILDLHRWCRCGNGHGRFEVLSAIDLGHAGMLRCVGCGRNGGWLRREHFQPGGRHLDG